MPCQNCSPNAIEFQCGDPPRLICVRSESDAIAIPAWVSPVCVADELTGIALFSDEAGTVPLVGYTYSDRVPCPENLLGTSCEAAENTNLCPDTLDAINTIVDDQTTAIVDAINHPADPNYTYAFTYTANGDVETVTRTTAVAGFVPCEVQTYSYNGSFQLTGTSAWVPCPQ